jgi:phage head maturation protease
MRFYWPIAKVDAEQRMVWGYASTEAEDDQGETVTRDALAAALDDYMRFANIREMHQPSAVGIATEASVDDKGLYLGAKIVDADAWQKVVEGVYKGFSIGGRVTARDSADRRLITGLRLTEISVVDRPANPEAMFDCWKLSTFPATGGSMATIAATARAPMQIWDCGVAAHRHLAKAQAMGCIEDHAPAGAMAPDDHKGDAAQSGAGNPNDRADYADPGYQADGRKRYPIDTERDIRAAWVYIHQPDNAERYTASQRERIKVRIVAAWQAKIGPEGPPALASEQGPAADTARKGVADVARLAKIIVDLEAVYERIAIEVSADGDDSPLPPQLQAIIAELHDLLRSLVAEESAEPVDRGDGSAPADLVAMSLADTLRKVRHPGLAPLASGLAKLAGEIVPRLDALQKRVEEIARTPLPPQTLARGFVGISKREDGGGAMPASEDIVAALARMSEEERTLTLIKAAHANPITPFGAPFGTHDGRPAGFDRR